MGRRKEGSSSRRISSITAFFSLLSVLWRGGSRSATRQDNQDNQDKGRHLFLFLQPNLLQLTTRKQVLTEMIGSGPSQLGEFFYVLMYLSDFRGDSKLCWLSKRWEELKNKNNKVVTTEVSNGDNPTLFLRSVGSVVKLEI